MKLKSVLLVSGLLSLGLSANAQFENATLSIEAEVYELYQLDASGQKYVGKAAEVVGSVVVETKDEYGSHMVILPMQSTAANTLSLTKANDSQVSISEVVDTELALMTIEANEKGFSIPASELNLKYQERYAKTKVEALTLVLLKTSLQKAIDQEMLSGNISRAKKLTGTMDEAKKMELIYNVNYLAPMECMQSPDASQLLCKSQVRLSMHVLFGVSELAPVE